jgi:hypothetical protein
VRTRSSRPQQGFSLALTNSTYTGTPDIGPGPRLFWTDFTNGAADSIRIGLGLPLSVEGGVIGRTEDLNRETLRQPQRASPQQEIARIAVDRAGIGDLKGSVSAGTYFICA